MSFTDTVNFRYIPEIVSLSLQKWRPLHTYTIYDPPPVWSIYNHNAHIQQYVPPISITTTPIPPSRLNSPSRYPNTTPKHSHYSHHDCSKYSPNFCAQKSPPVPQPTPQSPKSNYPNTPPKESAVWNCDLKQWGTEGREGCCIFCWWRRWNLKAFLRKKVKYIRRQYLPANISSWKIKIEKPRGKKWMQKRDMAFEVYEWGATAKSQSSPKVSKPERCLASCGTGDFKRNHPTICKYSAPLR